jgi:hypothetical protein
VLTIQRVYLARVLGPKEHCMDDVTHVDVGRICWDLHDNALACLTATGMPQLPTKVPHHMTRQRWIYVYDGCECEDA